MRDLHGVDRAKDLASRILNSDMTMRWSRQQWEWYQIQGVNTVVLDADEIITQPDVIKRYCEFTGLDYEKCRFEWEAIPHTTQANMDRIDRRMK